MGVIGLLLYLVFLMTGICAGLYKAIVHRSPVHAALTAMIIGYSVHGFLEQRAFNFANSISLMIIFSVALATKISLQPVQIAQLRTARRA